MKKERKFSYISLQFSFEEYKFVQFCERRLLVKQNECDTYVSMKKENIYIKKLIYRVINIFFLKKENGEETENRKKICQIHFPELRSIVTALNSNRAEIKQTVIIELD